jgi:hypothetical protein
MNLQTEQQVTTVAPRAGEPGFGSARMMQQTKLPFRSDSQMFTTMILRMASARWGVLRHLRFKPFMQRSNNITSIDSRLENLGQTGVESVSDLILPFIPGFMSHILVCRRGYRLEQERMGRASEKWCRR